DSLHRSAAAGLKKAGVRGERNELRRSHHAAQRMVPAKQRLEAGNDAGLKRDERLIKDFEFAGCERVAQIEFQRAAGSKAGVHIGLEKAKDAPAVFLGLIERHVV